jgi:hypothetical protein
VAVTCASLSYYSLVSSNDPSHPAIQATTATNQNTGGNETRGKNAYVIFCVKY